MDKAFNYSARGMVYGELWGGGYGAYPARKVIGSTLEGLKEVIVRELKSGGLDSGMGFKSLNGAYMIISGERTYREGDRTITETLDPVDEYFGTLTSDEQVFLIESYTRL